MLGKLFHTAAMKSWFCWSQWECCHPLNRAWTSAMLFKVSERCLGYATHMLFPMGSLAGKKTVLCKCWTLQLRRRQYHNLKNMSEFSYDISKMQKPFHYWSDKWHAIHQHWNQAYVKMLHEGFINVQSPKCKESWCDCIAENYKAHSHCGLRRSESDAKISTIKPVIKISWTQRVTITNFSKGYTVKIVYTFFCFPCVVRRKNHLYIYKAKISDPRLFCCIISVVRSSTGIF